MVQSRVLAVGLVLLCIVSASYGGLPAASTASAASDPPPQTATTVGSCTTITKPGTYVLTHDIHNGKTAISTGCLKIRANDVVLDGGGHTLDGYGVSDTSGVHVDGASNVTVRNLRTQDWNRGVYVEDASDVRVRDLVAVNNAIGIGVTGSDTRLVNNTVRGDLRGVTLDDSWDDTLLDNRIHHNRAIDIYAPVVLVHGFGYQLNVGPPLDPDKDGRYEDLTGNGKTGVSDAVAFPIIAAAETSGLTQMPAQQRAALDFDGDGNFDQADVLAYAGLTPSG